MSQEMKNSKIKNFLHNKWVCRYFKAVRKTALGILFFISAGWPIQAALEYGNAWWLLSAIITWPLAYICGYCIFEEFI